MAGRSVLFYFDKLPMFEKLGYEQLGRLTLAIMYYAKDSTEPDFKDDPLLDIVFAGLRGQIDEDTKKYTETVKRRAEAGKKGMLSRWNNDNKNDKTDSNVIANNNKDNKANSNAITNDNKDNKEDNTVITNITNITDTVTDTDTDTVTDTDTDTDTVTDTVTNKNNIEEEFFNKNSSLSEKISDEAEEQPKKPPQKVVEIVELYNSICTSLPKVKNISDTRAKAVNARLKVYNKQAFITLFEKAQDSDFLRGCNKNNWSADFDWLIRDANIAKVLDGKYDNIRETNGQGQYTGAGTPSLWEKQMQKIANWGG